MTARQPPREVAFDGIVGPTHNYAGMARGNVASAKHRGEASNPRQAALQGVAKMRFVARLGALQAVLPPQPRPSLRTLRCLGFRGSDEEVIAQASRGEEGDLPLLACSSAAAMWAANAATVAPSCDTADGRVHLAVANLATMFHRSIEAETTQAVLRAIFADGERFAVHDALPSHFADEGAANHTRLAVEGAAVHLFAWGRLAFGPDREGPTRYPARQTREASAALTRLLRVDPARALLPRQHPEGIDAGAFHSDVLAVGTGGMFLFHELAFADGESVGEQLRSLLGDSLHLVMARESELPVATAVTAYPFNSQLLPMRDGTMVLVAPVECRETPAARELLERVVEGDNPVRAIHYLDVRESMRNGGGPACLRLRVPLTDGERSALRGRVELDDELAAALEGWIGRHYRDRLLPADLSDPALARESMTALDELTGLLRLGSVYDFQA